MSIADGTIVPGEMYFNINNEPLVVLGIVYIDKVLEVCLWDLVRQRKIDVQVMDIAMFHGLFLRSVLE